MKKSLLSFTLAFLLAGLSACTASPAASSATSPTASSAASPEETSYESSYGEESFTLTSRRNTQIPAVLTLPQGKAGEKYPAVILCHGHGGSKEEGGGFTRLAGALAAQGIASIRIDFPGCGNSPEDFATANRLTNMLNDVATAKEYLLTHPQIDSGRLAIFGYSMGGRVAALTAANDNSYLAAGFWSPAVLPAGQNMYNTLETGDEKGYNALYAEAKEKGTVTFTTPFGNRQTLSKEWFEDMAARDPLAEFSRYTGRVLVISAQKDIVVPPEAAKALAAASTSAQSVEEVTIENAGHGYGIFTDEPEQTAQTIEITTSFFVSALQK